MADAQSHRILLVEDNDLIRDMAADILRDEGFFIAEAADVNEALKHLGDEDFDLLLSDVRLPGKSGRELADHLREQGNEMPIILMTGYSEESFKRDDFLARRMSLLRKPFQIRELLDAVRTALA
ncbi:MAG: response regulator [Pseudoxanthomonas sp.]